LQEASVPDLIESLIVEAHVVPVFVLV